MVSWNKICCAVDFAEPSRRALEVACDLARRLGADLTLVHVFEDPRVVGDSLASPPELYDQMAGETERNIASWRNDAARLSDRPVHSNVLTGRSAEALVQYFQTHDYDLVVMASHGRRGLQRLVLGSVAERVVREAGCPVLVVRGGVPAPD
jgi:universal stress protein A